MPAADRDRMGQFLQLVEQRREDVLEALGALDDPSKKRFVLLAKAAISNHQHRDGTCTCTVTSMWQALIDACETELVPDTVEGLAYLISYPPELTFVISYKGMIKRIMEAGVCDHILADVIRQKDFRRMRSGKEGRRFAHNYDPTHTNAQRGSVVGVFSEATLANGIKDWEFMNLDDIEAIKTSARRTGKGRLGPAWQAYEGEMLKKSVMRRHMKRLQGTRRVEGLAANRLAAALAIENREFDFKEQSMVPPGQTDFDSAVDDLKPKRPEPTDDELRANVRASMRAAAKEEAETVETTARRVEPEPPPPPKEPEPERTLDEKEQGLVEQALSKGGWLARDWPKILQEYAGVNSADQIKISKLPGVVNSLEQAGREP